eukprot:TRINITY_DN39595_c0_g1_i1.p2 TRINITY_DN39595_c0_g1~~TRINITY_DN39595_c0_g1_i1.p2  ORF type:complete len:160 (+),score=26.54 TRINITY_DN39595_c0_g1_i1:3-482(+)
MDSPAPGQPPADLADKLLALERESNVVRRQQAFQHLLKDACAAVDHAAAQSKAKLRRDMTELFNKMAGPRAPAAGRRSRSPSPRDAGHRRRRRSPTPPTPPRRKSAPRRQQSRRRSPSRRKRRRPSSTSSSSRRSPRRILPRKDTKQGGQNSDARPRRT